MNIIIDIYIHVVFPCHPTTASFIGEGDTWKHATVVLMASSGTELANKSDTLTGQSFFPGLQQKKRKGGRTAASDIPGVLMYILPTYTMHINAPLYKYTTLKIAIHLPCLILPIQVLQWPLSIRNNRCFSVHMLGEHGAPCALNHQHISSFEAGRLWSNVELLQTANKNYISSV